MLDNRGTGATMEVSPPIPVRIEWAASQGNVTASWLTAHFKFKVHRVEKSEAKSKGQKVDDWLTRV